MFFAGYSFLAILFQYFAGSRKNRMIAREQGLSILASAGKGINMIDLPIESVFLNYDQISVEYKYLWGWHCQLAKHN